MKKSAATLAVLIYLCMAMFVYAIPAYAAEVTETHIGRGTVENPVNYWDANGYPNNVSFAYESDNVWVIGVINADDASIRELVDLFSPNVQVTFRDALSSFNQRKAAVDEINASRDSKIGNAAMAPKSEVIFVEIAEGYEGEYSTKFSKQFGFSFIAVDDVGAAIGAEPGGLAGNRNNSFGYWFAPIILLFLIGTTVVFFKRIRLVPAMQTANGNIVTASTPATRKETIAAIKNSAVTPPDSVYKSIMEKVDNKR